MTASTEPATDGPLKDITPCAGNYSVAWPSERLARAQQRRHQQAAAASNAAGDDDALRRQMVALAERWLAPFKAQGVRLSDLTSRSGERNDRALLDPAKVCPIVGVRRGSILISIPNASSLRDRCLSGCANRVYGSFGRRILTVMRMLQTILNAAHSDSGSLQSLATVDFALKLCVDDTCHGEHEQHPVPFWSMVSCATAPSIPVVQWNTADARDPDLAVWDGVLRHRRLLRQRAGVGGTTVKGSVVQGGGPGAGWAQRQATAVFRGAINENVATNSDWTFSRLLHRVRFRDRRWRRQGRLALLYQRCQHPPRPPQPQILNVRIVSGTKRLAQVNDSAFWQCVDSIHDAPKTIPLEQQASTYKYVVHVEGNGGWSDRLKHLYTSGMTVIKQDMGVSEFFEPLFIPYRHYVPVDSALTNLSDAILWARANDQQARQMAADAATLAEQVLSERGLHMYMQELLVRYAALFARTNHGAVEAEWDALLPPSQTAHFQCDGVDGVDSATSCSFRGRTAASGKGGDDQGHELCSMRAALDSRISDSLD